MFAHVTGKGAVDFAEFMKMMAKNGPTTASEIKETFAIFNSSGRCVCCCLGSHTIIHTRIHRHSGKISKDELKTIMGKFGENISDSVRLTFARSYSHSPSLCYCMIAGPR